MTAPANTAELKRLAEAATPGEWKRCHHLMGSEQDASCPCGYRGGIWAIDKDCILLEMGGPKTPGEEGLDPPRLPRAEELANAAFIAAANPETILSLISTIERQAEENAAFRGALIAIAAMTDPDDGESYRSDDREGCLDAVHSVSTEALSHSKTKEGT